MNPKERKVIFIAIGVVLAVMVLVMILKSGKKESTPTNNIGGTGSSSNVGTTSQNKEQYATTIQGGVKINTSSEFNQVKKYNNLEISNIQFTYEDGKSVLIADVKNVGTTLHDSEIVKVTILDANGKALFDSKPVLPRVEPGQTKQLTAYMSGDIVNAKDFKIEAK